MTVLTPKPAVSLSGAVALALALALALAAIVLVPTSHASDYALPEVVVTGRQVLADSPVVVREISQDDIAAWNSHNAAETLVQTPGINVQYGGSSGDARAWIRGFRHRDVLILFDGIPIASAFEGTIDLNEISLSNVDRIKVTKSAPSVIYGPNGMGGVIDFIPSTGQRDSSLTGGIEVGDNDAWRLNGGLSGQQGTTQYLFTASYDTAGAYELSDDYVPQLNEDGGTRENSDHLRKNVFGYLNNPATPLGSTSLFFQLSDNERGFNTEAGIDDPDFERLSESKRRTVGISNRFANLPLSAKLYYNSYESQLDVYTDATFSELDESELTEDYSVGGMLYSAIPLNDNNLLVMNLSARKDHFEGAGAFEDFDAANLDTWTLAVEDEFSIADRFSVAVGGMFSTFDQPEANRRINEFNPQVAAAWELSDDWSLHASAAQRTRFPKLRELYRRRWGNPELDVQTAVNYEFGIRSSGSQRLRSDFTLFLSNVDDLIERPDRDSTYLNLDEIRFRGVEAASGGWLNDKTFVRLAYTYLDAEEKLPDGGQRQLRSRARHSAYGELRYRFATGYRLALNAIYSAGLYDLNSDQDHVRLPEYFVLHAKVSKSLSDHLDAYVSIANLMDTDYLHRLGFPREGRALRVGVSFNR